MYKQLALEFKVTIEELYTNEELIPSWYADFLHMMQVYGYS